MGLLGWAAILSSEHDYGRQAAKHSEFAGVGRWASDLSQDWLGFREHGSGSRHWDAATSG